MHEYAHLAVARCFGACGFVTVARVAGLNGELGSWHSAFQLFGELTDDEWRVVALAGMIAERFDAGAAFDTRSLLEALQRPGALSDSDASLAFGYDARDIECCVKLLTTSWRAIETDAADRAASVRANHAELCATWS